MPLSTKGLLDKVLLLHDRGSSVGGLSFFWIYPRYLFVIVISGLYMYALYVLDFLCVLQSIAADAL